MTLKTSQLITKGNALNSEKEFPLLLKFPFAIQHGSNIFFHLDFILHLKTLSALASVAG